jgi:putative flippase GtrA
VTVRRLAQRRGVRQFVKFGIVGASGLVVNFLIFTWLQHGTPFDEQRARFTLNYSVSFLSGGVSNYVLNRIWTFRAKGHAVLQGVQFLIVSGVALLVGLGVSAVAKPYLGPGHKTWLLATMAGILVNFFANKYWTFRPPQA